MPNFNTSSYLPPRDSWYEYQMAEQRAQMKDQVKGLRKNYFNLNKM